MAMTEAEGLQFADAKQEAVKAKLLLRIAEILIAGGPLAECIDRMMFLREMRQFLGLDGAA